jgi:hypothetical protein
MGLSQRVWQDDIAQQDVLDDDTSWRERFLHQIEHLPCDGVALFAVERARRMSGSHCAHHRSKVRSDDDLCEVGSNRAVDPGRLRWIDAEEQRRLEPHDQAF